MKYNPTLLMQYKEHISVQGGHNTGSVVANLKYKVAVVELDAMSIPATMPYIINNQGCKMKIEYDLN